jgi:hypothetical protein
MLNLLFFPLRLDNFGLPDSGPQSADSFESASNPDPKHCLNITSLLCFQDFQARLLAPEAILGGTPRNSYTYKSDDADWGRAFRGWMVRLDEDLAPPPPPPISYVSSI